MIRNTIEKNYASLKETAMKAGLSLTPNKQLIEDLFHNVLLSILNNPKHNNITPYELKGYVYRSIQINFKRELEYSRNKKRVYKIKLEDY